MVDKKDHGKGGRTTNLILDSLNESILPDHLLSDESPIKKQRQNNQFFNELRYAIFLESIRLYTNFIAYLKAQREKFANLKETKDFDLKTLLQGLKSNVSLATINKGSVEEQKQKLKVVEMKFEYLTAFINSKLSNLSNMLNKERTNLAELTEKRNTLNQTLASKLKNHFDYLASDPEAEPVIKITLPEELAYLKENSQFTEEVKLDKNIFKALSDIVNTEMIDQGKPMHEVQAMINTSFEKSIMDDVKDKFSFLSDDEYTHLINAQEKNIENVMNFNLWHDVLRDTHFIDALKQSYEIENKIEISETQIAIVENSQARLLQLQSDIAIAIKKEIAELKAIEQNLFNENDNNKLIQTETMIDSCFDHINLLESNYKQELADIIATTNEVNEFYSDLIGLETQAANMMEDLKNGMDDRIDSNVKTSMFLTLNSIHEDQEELLLPKETEATPALTVETSNTEEKEASFKLKHP